MQNKEIETLKELYKKLDKLYQGIYKFCKICKEEDCKGYVWLLPEEAKKLEGKISLIEINKKFYFLDSFIRKDGTIDVEEIKPSCVFRMKNKKCAIYHLRPLICRLYPLDFRIRNKKIYIVLHTDCLFVKRLIKFKKISHFLEKALNIFYNCDRELLKRILKEYKSISSISKYPKDYKHDDYLKLLKIDNLKQIKLKLCQSVKQFLTLKK